MEHLLEFCQTETQRATVEAIINHGGYRKAAKALGKHQRTVEKCVERIRYRAAKQGVSPDHDMTHPVPDGYRVKGVSTLYGPDGDVKAQWVKSQVDQNTLQECLDGMLQGLEIPRIKPTKVPKISGTDLMNVYVFGDPHLDMLAYAPEVGADWDMDIAIEQHQQAMLDLVRRSPRAEVGVLATMGDLWHRDSLKALTPGNGNLVDVDGRLAKSMKRTVSMMRSMIDRMLRKYSVVKVVVVPGNHSETLERALAVMLQIAYENEPRTEVLDNIAKHIPLTYKKNFLLFTHGDRLNDQKKADIAVGHFRKEHGAAEFTHVLTGHVHHATQKELSGVLVETFQVLPTPDAWHFESGYVTADQSASVLTYHAAGGISDRTITNPRIFMDQSASK